MYKENAWFYLKIRFVISRMITTLFCIIICIIIVSCSKTSNIKVLSYTSISENINTIKQHERDIPVVGSTDVIVAGGGVAGVAAALSAAKEGYSVVLLEQRNYLGQEFTASFKCSTNPGLPADTSNNSSLLCNELIDNGILKESFIDPQDLRSFLHKKIAEQPLIKVYLYSMANGVVIKDDRICGVIFSGRDNRQIILANAVIDATEDARLAATAGVEMKRTMIGEKTVHRYMSVNLPKNVPLGPLNISGIYNLNNTTRCTLHNGYVEMVTKVVFGKNFARDHSNIQSKTLEICFNMRDYFEKIGWLSFSSLGNYTNNIIPSPETYIDEMPVAECIDRLTEKEINELDFSKASLVKPKGVNGLLVAGRTIDTRIELGSLQALLGIGELAGRTISEVLSKNESMNLIKINSDKHSNKEGLQVSELLSGIDPNVNYPRLSQAEMELPVCAKYDVLVVGGGTSGAIAAIASARQGISVAIIEILPNLGGIGSNKISTYYWGVPWKSFLRQELGDRIHLMKNTGENPLEVVRYSGEDKKFALQDMAEKAGVHIYYQTLGAGAIVEDNRVKGIVVENIAGRQVILANVVIDATGHAGIAVSAGAEFEKGRITDGFLHEMYLGLLRDPTHIEDVSSSYLRFPSTAFSLSMNMRESRRILGDYMVSFQDAINERIFPDVICRWYSHIDTHFPSSANQSDLAQDWYALLGLRMRPILGCIPFRSVLPKGLDNILVTGMAHSTEHDVLSGSRMQADLEHLGEAVGIAAAIACKSGIAPRDISIENLQLELVHLGVLRKEDLPSKIITGEPSVQELHAQDFWKNERDDWYHQRDKKFPSNITLEEIVQLLGTDNSIEAMVRLYLAGDKAIPLLQPLVKSSNRSIHEESVILLGLLGDRTVIPELIKFLSERNARRFVFTIPEPKNRPSVPLYWSAAILLGRFKVIEAVPLIIEILNTAPSPKEFDQFNRFSYCDVMFESTEICPPPLASFLIVALGRIGDPKAIEAVRPFLNVSSEVDFKEENKDFEIAWGVKTNAAWALAQMGDWSGIPVLIELLNADQARLRNYAHTLLKNITRENFEINNKVWEKWWESI